MLNKMRKNWMAIAGISIAAGIALIVIGVMLGGTPLYTFAYDSVNKWQFSTNDMGEDPVIMDQTITEAFDSLYVKVDMMDVYIESGDEYSVSYASAHGELDMKITNGTLNLTRPSRLHLFSWGFYGEGYSGVNQYYVRITIPEDTALQDLKIVSETGNVYISDAVSTGRLEIQMEYGDADIQNSQISEGGVKTEAGDISLDEISADKISLETEFGRVTGKNITTESLTACSESGDISLEELTTGMAEIKTESGDVKLGLAEKEEVYEFVLDTEFGNVILNSGKSGSSYSRSRDDGKRVKVSAEIGDIVVETN